MLFYFFFSVEHTGPGKVVARTGILFLMIAFGAAFGYTVMARMSLLIGRLTDLIEFTDPSYGRPSLWLLGLTILTLVVMARRSSRRAPEEKVGLSESVWRRIWSIWSQVRSEGTLTTRLADRTDQSDQTASAPKCTSSAVAAGAIPSLQWGLQ